MTSSHAPPFGGRRVWPFATAIVAATILGYTNCLHVPLLLDDEVTIRDNASLRNLTDWISVLFPPAHVFSSGRPLLNLSFALNYPADGSNVAGYHVVNVLIHVVAAMILFGLLRRALRLPRVCSALNRAAVPCAATAAMIWALHPALTEAVTYVSQRAESLMGLFFFLTLYAFVRGTAATGPSCWLNIAVAACWAGTLVKEVMVTAPVVVLLFDSTFVAGSFRMAWARRAGFYVALAGSWLLLSWLMMASHAGRRGIGFDHDLSWWRYAALEARAIFQYLKLAVWPHPLVFDYGERPFPAPAGVAGAFVGGVLALVVASLRLFLRSPVAGFLPVVFWIVLAPTSSIVPIVAQPVAESRMYLPTAVLVSGVAIAGVAVLGTRRALMIATALAVACAVATHARNHDYRSAKAIWTDTTAKMPSNPRAHLNLGLALSQDRTNSPLAVHEYEIALRLKPSFAEAEYNLGLEAQLAGNYGAAIRHYERALQLRPHYASAHNNLGLLLASAPAQREAAIRHFQAALKLDRTNTEARFNLANLLSESPATRAQAIQEYRDVVAALPRAAEPHNNLAIALAQSGDLTAAVAELRIALQLQPDYAEARRNLQLIQDAANQP